MSHKLLSIHLKNFRGARDLTIPMQVEGKPVSLLLIGENGTGKSSIIDGIEHFFVGEVEHLRYSTAAEHKEALRNTQAPKRSKSEVAVEFSEGNETIQVTVAVPYNNPGIPTVLQGFYHLARSKTFILRRAQLLNFINAKENDRYNRVSEIVGMGQLDEIETALKSVSAKYKSDKRAQENQIVGSMQAIQKEFKAIVNSPEDVLGLLNQRLATIDSTWGDLRSFDDIPAKIEKVRSQIQRTLQDDALIKQNLLGAADRADETAKNLDRVISEYRKLNSEWVVYLRVSAQLIETVYNALLHEADTLIVQGKHAADNCPLCKQPIELSSLTGKIKQRIKSLETYQVAESKVKIVANGLKSLLRLAESNLKNLLGLSNAKLNKDWVVLLEHVDETLNDLLEKISGDKISISGWNLISAEQWITATETDKCMSALRNIAEQCRQQAAQTPESDNKLNELISHLERAKVFLETWQREIAKAELLRFYNDQAELAYEAFVEAKEKQWDTLRQELEEDFIRFYSQLHPGEGYQKIAIPTPKTQVNSTVKSQKTEIAITAHGKTDADPRGYLSEGHLDSLGMCIFLAFIKKFNTGLELIILDDVLTSVDANHRIRIAQLLCKEFPKHQFIITTHDRLWAQELKQVMSNNKMKNVSYRLMPWNLQDGVRYSEYGHSDWNYYIKQIEEGHVSDAIAGTGRQFEKFLFEMRRGLLLSVPATATDQYTIGDLYSPFIEWINKRKIERPDKPAFDKDISDAIKEIDDIWRLRNWSGAHYNTWGDNVSPAEALYFVKAIQRLITLLTCPVCQTLVVYNNKAKVLHCPHCSPSPAPKVVYEFDPKWKERVDDLLTNQHKPNPSAAIKRTQAIFRAFLRDGRKLWLFSPKPAANDKFELEHLYVPFIEWGNSLNLSSDSRIALDGALAILSFYISTDNWINIANEQASNFIQAIDGLITFFLCPICQRIRRYESGTQNWLCITCDDKQATKPISTNWSVSDN